MNRIEFEEVMKATDIDNPLSSTTNRLGDSESVHYWNNVALWFNGTYYVRINGKIPFEVANIICEKYPDNQYNIRVNGGCKDWKAIDCAKDEKYENEIKELVEEFISEKYDIKKLKEKTNIAEEKLKNRSNDKKYIKGYDIDSKEGFLIFITEMKDYYLRKNNLPETEVNKYEDLLAEVTSEVLKRTNPGVTVYDWMQKDNDNKYLYNFALNRDNKSEAGRTIRNLISEFDKAVNPFINNDIELDDVKNYMHKVEVETDEFKEEKNSCSLHISIPGSHNEVYYERNANGFSFCLFLCSKEKEYLRVFHHFNKNANHVSNIGEIIGIEKRGDNIENTNLCLNLTTGKAGEINKEKEPVTSNQLLYIYDELKKAIAIASSITVDNMSKEATKTYSKI